MNLALPDSLRLIKLDSVSVRIPSCGGRMDRTMKMKLMVIVYAVLMLIVGTSGTSEIGYPRSGEGFQNKTVRQRVCVENQEYPHNDFCCKNCEAGTYVSTKCSAHQEKGTCMPCEQGTYAEHPTGMDQCLQCSPCHADQKVTAECTSVRNTQCECKPGLYCPPDEPCEVCKKCTRCKADEIEERQCTPTSNAKCRKNPHHDPPDVPTPSPDSQNSTTTIIAVVALLAIAILVMVAVAVWFFRTKYPRRSEASPVGENDDVKIPIEGIIPSAEEKENSRNAGLEEAEEPRPEFRPLLPETQAHLGNKSIPVEDEDRGLGDSLPNTTSSSQTSLTSPPVTIVPVLDGSPRHSPCPQRPVCNGERDPEPWNDGSFKRLVPLLGEETSLSKSFDLFDVLDMRVHNKFFRRIGIRDNDIKRVETHNAADKVYELLRIWMQSEGLRANINDLLQALLDLDQRYSAEQITSKAVERGYYRYE